MEFIEKRRYLFKAKYKANIKKQNVESSNVDILS